MSELFEDHRKDYNVMKRIFAGPPIMKDEIQAAIRKMKLVKATRPDSISVELIEAIEDYGIDKITTLLDEIFDPGQFPPDIFKSIFFAPPKKPKAKESESHRMLNLMSHITKMLLRLIMM